MVLKEDILDSLKVIIDPDLGQDIVTLGFVKELKIEDGGHVSFDIELTTPACPVKDKFKTDAENAVRALNGVNSVAVTMTAAPRNLNSNRDSGLKDTATIIAVSSCKGGVGKSTISALIARELAHQGHIVGLLDADVHGPSIPTIFNKRSDGIKITSDKYFIPLEEGNLRLMSFGFLAGDAPAVMRGPMVGSYMQQMLHNVAWGKMDYLIIDMPPGTSDIMLTVTQQIQIDGAVIVTTPHSLSLADVGKGIVTFDRVNVPCLGVIENMAYFTCDNCDKKHHVFGAAGAQQLQERFGLDILAELPITDALGGNIEELEKTDIPQQVVGEVIRALGKKMMSAEGTPEVSFNSMEVTLQWPNGEIQSVNNHDLRCACHCAECVDEMTGRPLLDPNRVPMDVQAEEIKIVGNYALQVQWSDNHSAGLFPFKRIKEMAG